MVVVVVAGTVALAVVAVEAVVAMLVFICVFTDRKIIKKMGHVYELL